jgi:diguanylate cyclase (GGDEF)-like protein
MGSKGMNGVLLKASAVTVASVIASLLIVAALGVEISGNSLWLPIVCPVLIAFPGSAFSFWTMYRHRLLHEELARTHAALEDAHAQLAEKSRRDPMTGLLNREAFFAAVESTRRRMDRGAFLLIDSDHAKRINDSYGHLAGDDALIEIAQALRGAVGEQDIVGRIGGDEFGVLVSGATKEAAQQAAERIRAAVAAIAFMPAQGKTMTLTVTIGAAFCWPDARIADLMRSADRQLNKAKREGRNRALFDVGSSVAA